MATDIVPGGSPPQVSVVVPVLDDPCGIERCLEALLRQAYPPNRFEIIVVDNGSTDGTRTVVERFCRRVGSRLSLLVEDQVRTSYGARNRGIRAARGQVLAFTDADCVPTPTWLECGVRALDVEVAPCVSGRIVMTYRGPRPNVYEYWDSAIRLDQEAFAALHFGATANLFVRAHTFARHGGFRPELISGGDRELGVRLWNAGERLRYAPDAIVMHPARATLREVYQKSMRIARVRSTLHQLGAVARGDCARKLIESTWRCPAPRDWVGRPSLGLAAAARLLHHLNAWLLVMGCFMGGVRAWAFPRPVTRPVTVVPVGEGSAPGVRSSGLTDALSMASSGRRSGGNRERS